mmetsp:Transcript_3009/g.5687  ORF Transcript_3009/g.5687 Transcript_3009/m.5687 type:complete len:512 (-) Transcript_3009:170-1705(-)
MKKSGYSLRLRPRERTNVGAPGSNNEATAKATASKRTVLGDVSNRKSGRVEDEEGKVISQAKSATTKPSATAIAETVVGAQNRRGKSTATKGKSTGAEKKLPRRSSSRIASLKKAVQENDEKKTIHNEKTAGAKRPRPENNPQLVGYNRVKRAKASESTAGTRSGRFRLSSRRRSAASDFERRENVIEIIQEEHHIVPINFRLTRPAFRGHNHTHGIAHYDAVHLSNPLLCTEYVTDLYQQFYHVETQTHPRPYMDEQDDINSKMRAILVDWIVEVHLKFRLVPETLYLCVNIIDRYCSKVVVQRSKLQLIGVTALLVACKHEEIYPPEVRDCVYITDRAYERQEVLDMEQSILRVLNWKISVPTAYPFLYRFLSITEASNMTKHAAKYYLERTLQEHDFLYYRPSVVCAGAVILALNNPDIRVREEDYQRKLPGLPQILMEYTEFEKDELVKVMSEICDRVAEEPITASRRQLTAVKRKYSNKKYLSVATEIQLPSIHHVTEHLSSEDSW